MKAIAAAALFVFSLALAIVGDAMPASAVVLCVEGGVRIEIQGNTSSASSPQTTSARSGPLWVRICPF